MTLPAEGETREPMDREFHLLFVRKDTIPSDTRGNEIISPDYRPLAKSLAKQLPEGSPMRHALEHPSRRYAFRGLQRPNDPQLLRQAIETINECGIDRGGPNGEKTWFETTGDISYPMDIAMPKDSEHTGFLIISRKDGLHLRRHHWLHEAKVKPGETFKSIHIGTLAFRVY